MKLVQTILNQDGTLNSTKALDVRPADLNRLRGMFLYGKNLYQLKKHKRLEVIVDDGRVIYELLDK